MNAKANSIGDNTREKARELQEKLYLAAKKSATRRFHALYDKIYRMDILEQGWDQVKENKGSPGVDEESIEDFIRTGELENLGEIQAALMNKKYRPRKVKRIYIPKPDGRQRPLGIPTIRDRIVQASTKYVMEPIFEVDFLDCSYGFRPNRSANQALEEIRRAMNNYYEVVLDADIKGFFDNIDHEQMLSFVQQRISDRRVLKLIRKWLKCGVMDSGVVYESELGTPQGGVISPLLANIYLHEFDKFWTTQDEVRGKLVRYADDFVILFRTMEDAERGLQLVRNKLEELGLELNEEKTDIIDTRKGKKGFDFLGFHVRQVYSKPRWGYYAQMWPSARSMNRIRAKIKEFMGKPSTPLRSLEDVIRTLNPILRGWMNYYRFGNSSKHFNLIDRYVQERLGNWWRKKINTRGAKWRHYFPPERLKACGVQILTGNVIYWKHYRKLKEEGHRRAV